jgi:hypothetical protein
MADDYNNYPCLLDWWSPDRRFLNLGVGGFGTHQERLLYEDLSPDYDHDLVILGFHFNDPADNTEALRREEAPTDQSSVPAPVAADVDRERGRPSAYARARSLLSQSAFIGTMQDRLRRLRQRQLNERARPSDEALDDQLALTRAHLEAIASVARSHGADMLIVTFPPRASVYPDRPAYFARDVEQRLWEQQVTILEEMARQDSALSLLDLTPRLQAWTHDEPLYAQVDSHMTEAGYRFSAREIHGWLVDHGYVEARDVDFSRRFGPPANTCP